MCLTHANQNASSCRSITIRDHINQDWDQDREWNKGFKQKKILFFNKIYICLIRVPINQDWDQDWEWNKGFKQKKYSFLIKNLHLLLDILHTALPSGNTCQMCNESLL